MTSPLQTTSRFAPCVTPCAVPRRVGRAFTMIEILTVVAIIALLATITVVGINVVGGNAKEKQARTVLEVMRSALAQAVPIDDSRANDKFYGNVIVKTYKLDPPNPPQPPVPGGLDARTLAADTETLQIIRYIGSNPGAKAQIEGLPTQLRKTVSGVTVPVDPWGNEIRFVYGKPRLAVTGELVTVPTLGGLGKMYSKSASQYWRGIGSYTPPVSGLTDRSTVVPNEYALQSPDKGPFWVSAGPDGDFETHDDNLYSFEGN